MSEKKYSRQTGLTHWGRDPDDYHGIVNPPIARASTILYPSLAAYENKDHVYRYGRMGNPLSRALEGAAAKLENGYDAISAPSGLLALTTALLAFLRNGDHLLIADTIYPPLRAFCGNVLVRMGVEVEFYDPLTGGGIRDLIREETRVIYLESPGSGTFEVMDVPAVVAAAKGKDIVTVADNTWSAGLLFRPLDHGVDIALQSATKYIGGHSDINLGIAVAAREEIYKTLKKTALDLGVCAGAEDMYLALRGLRTMALRMRQSAEYAGEVTAWLQGRDEVQKIYYPALPDHPGHEIWKRDFSGANGVFSILLQPAPKAAVSAFVDALELFPIGSSWGGYESLLQPQYPQTCRSAVPWKEDGMLLRLQIGLEDPQDLIADLAQGLEKFNAAR